jgi:hypothetical protein
MNITTILAQVQTTTESTTLNPTAALIFYAAIGIIVLITIIAQYIVFEKAGEMGIAAIVPIWSQWVTFKMGGMPGWYALLLLVPLINFIASLMLLFAHFNIAKSFGYGFLMGLVLIFLPPIGWIVLASEGEYMG